MGFFTIGFGMLVLFSLFLIYLEIFDPRGPELVLRGGVYVIIGIGEN